MNCTIKLNISYLLKKIIEQLIDDINYWYKLEYSDEFLLYLSLNKIVESSKICDKPCMGCLDYELVNRIFIDDFITRIKELNEENSVIINELSLLFDLPKSSNPVTLALDLFSNPKYVNGKLDISQKDIYSNYLNEINCAISTLAINYYIQKKTEFYDIIIDSAPLETEQEITYKLTDQQQGSKIFYIDQNFISEYINDFNFKTQIENIKKADQFRFVFSPYLVEDGIKMNKVFLKDYFENIYNLTNGVFIAKYFGNLSFVTEEIDNLVKRIILWARPTKAAEELKLIDAIYNSYVYPELNKNNKIIQDLNNNPKMFFKMLDEGNYGEELKYLLTSIIVLNSLHLNLDDLANCRIHNDNDFDCINKIGALCQFLDILNYKTEAKKDKNKIKSSYQDTEHLKHAWKADYFVTNDNNLAKRGTYIYSTLGLKTTFITINKFKGMMTIFYK